MVRRDWLDYGPPNVTDVDGVDVVDRHPDGGVLRASVLQRLGR